jgi:plasmid stabilization system protein ParE
MEKGKRVQLSSQFETDIHNLYEYGVETFGLTAAELYKQHIMALTYGLCDFYLMYPECRHIITKSRMYRNIILESHLIIYRINLESIQVLRVLHTHSSISKIKNTRSIKL